jgi:hypothetical protein
MISEFCDLPGNHLQYIMSVAVSCMSALAKSIYRIASACVAMSLENRILHFLIGIKLDYLNVTKLCWAGLSQGKVWIDHSTTDHEQNKVATIL